MSPRIALGVGLLLASLACQPTPEPPKKAPSPEKSRYFGGAPDGKLHVYFFDVGAGEAALIISPSGNTVLVDSGPATAESHLVNRLPELLRRELDLVVLTHPDPKHHGALDAVLKRVGARRLLEPQLPDTSSAYDTLLGAVGSRGVQVFSPASSANLPQESVRLQLEDEVNLTVLWPRAPATPLLKSATDAEGRNAANSIVLRLTYRNTSVLFAGAARAETEEVLLANGLLGHATLLKVASPGVAGANSQGFLEEVRPQGAVFSMDEGLGRDAKVRDVMTRLKGVGAKTFRTDVNGEMHAVSDGKQFELTLQRPTPGEPASARRIVLPGVDTRPALVKTAKPPPPPPVVVKPQPEPPVVAKVEPTRTVDTPRGTTPRWGSEGIDVDPLPAATKAVRKEDIRRAAQRAPTGGYVASRNRRIFHKVDCQSAAMIKDKNLVVFRTRDEALKSNFEPAPDCKP
ncbi:hypothetical protein D7X74_24615 [Corallococcus sp. CA047B]|uniref:ComEC/Rec2 family competence protein n=1 Tax=Corallococcus sp. CA047B TaxID=2316729 RepID=UPI000EA2730B|nr:MBL fold metallo-hydrolase [Corallococcus sp. CA047B]RKH11894.1 hypothetical protein D7X74_24615 [Corallococcus sp. CA047B]